MSVRKSPKILNGSTVDAAKSACAVNSCVEWWKPLDLSEYAERCGCHKKQRTNVDDLYDTIRDKCTVGYRFTDNYCGIPWIERSDIEDKGNGIYVVRFRSPVEYSKDLFFGRMSRDVCEALNCNLHVLHKTKHDLYFGKIGQEYEEYVWVLQPGELDTVESEETAREDERQSDDVDPIYDFQDVEDMPDDFECESTDEEIDAGIEKALAEFV